MLLVHLFVCLHVLDFVLFSFSWYRGLAAVCDCGTPWTFLFTCFSIGLAVEYSSCFICHRRILIYGFAILMHC